MPLNEQHDDKDWAYRSKFLSNHLMSRSEKPTKLQRAAPLVLCGYGASLRVHAGTLCVRNGFTYHPQKREEWRLFPGDPSLPERLVMVDGTGSLTFDVLDWLSKQQISLVRIDWRGNVVTAIGDDGYTANKFRVQWQQETRDDPGRRMAFANHLITRKIEGCVKTLEKGIRRSAAWELAMKRAYSDLTRLDVDPPRTIPELRILEANSAARYFRAWRGIPLKWKGTAKRPIPEQWRTIGPRTSPFSRAGNRNAGHPVTAMLNYAYTVLQSEVQIQVVTDGLDPKIGIMHEQSPSASAFVFDVMEPLRAVVDRELLLFIKNTTFDPSDFILRSDGVCRLNPQLARSIVSLLIKNLAKEIDVFYDHA